MRRVVARCLRTLTGRGGVGRCHALTESDNAGNVPDMSRSLVQLTIKAGNPNPQAKPQHKPVWINPLGVNAVQEASDGGTSVRMDDGMTYPVCESVEYVVCAIDQELQDA